MSGLTRTDHGAVTTYAAEGGATFAVVETQGPCGRFCCQTGVKVVRLVSALEAIGEAKAKTIPVTIDGEVKAGIVVERGANARHYRERRQDALRRARRLAHADAARARGAREFSEALAFAKAQELREQAVVLERLQVAAAPRQRGAAA